MGQDKDDAGNLGIPPTPFPERFNDPEVQHDLDEAAKAGRWMVAIWYVKDGQVRLFRKTHAFPLQDLDIALGQMAAEVQKIQTKEGPPGDIGALVDLAKPPKPRAFRPEGGNGD